MVVMYQMSTLGGHHMVRNHSYKTKGEGVFQSTRRVGISTILLT